MTEIVQSILEMYKYLGTINSFIRKKCDQYLFKLRRKYTKTNYLEFDIFSLVLENLKKTKFVELDFTIKYNTIQFEISYINDKFSKNDIEILLDIFFQLTKELKVNTKKNKLTIEKKYIFKIIHIENIYDYKLFWEVFKINSQLADNELQFSNGLYFLSDKIKLKNSLFFWFIAY